MNDKFLLQEAGMGGKGNLEFLKEIERSGEGEKIWFCGALKTDDDDMFDAFEANSMFVGIPEDAMGKFSELSESLRGSGIAVMLERHRCSILIGNAERDYDDAEAVGHGNECGLKIKDFLESQNPAAVYTDIRIDGYGVTFGCAAKHSRARGELWLDLADLARMAEDAKKTEFPEWLEREKETEAP